MMKRWKKVVLALCVAASPVAAQERVDLATIARIKEEAQQRSQVLATFNTLTNVIGPRLTGSPAHKQAADWTREQLADVGPQQRAPRAVRVRPRLDLEKLTLELTGPRYFPLHGYPGSVDARHKGRAGAARRSTSATRPRRRSKALGERVRGAIVLLQPPQTQFIKEDRLQPSRRARSACASARRQRCATKANARRRVR